MSSADGRARTGRLLPDALLRLAATVWLPRFQVELDLLPAPADRARQHARGADPVRALVFGSGPANGFGVRTVDLALPGQLARALRDRTGRGAEVDVDARRGVRIETVGARLDALRLDRYDAVLLCLGATDAGAVLPLDRWRDAMTAVLQEVRDQAPAAALAVTSTSPLQQSPRGTGWFFERIDGYARRLDAVTAEVVAAIGDPGIGFVPLAPLLAAAGGGYASADGYRLVAEHVAAMLADRLPESGARWARGRRDDPADAAGRADALAATGLAETPPGDRVVRLVRSARDLFGVRGSALTLVGRDELHIRVRSGFGGPDQLDRRGSLAERAVRADGPLVVGDVPAELRGLLPRFAGRATRFYAAHPIESPSGHRIGALCLLDDRPRDPASVDAAALHDLALAVQAELWDRALQPTD